MTRWVWGVAFLAVVLLAACSRKSDAGPGATVPVEQPTVTTTSVPNVDEIPAVIDEAYLNRVLEALDAVNALATKIIFEHKDLVPEAAEILNAIYSNEEFSRQADIWLTTLEQDPNLDQLKPDPGPRKTTVRRIIGATPTCVWLAVERDYSPVAKLPSPPRSSYLALQPLDPSNDPRQRNRTAWMIAADGLRHDEAEPSSPC